MDPHHSRMIAKDAREVHDARERLAVNAKLIWYAFSRPIMSARLKKELRRLLPTLEDDPVFRRTSLFLNGDGGMFKKYAYGLCDRLRPRPLKGASILVPGIGYGQNLMQLAAFRPKEIVAFDLFEYPEEWRLLTGKIRADFGVPVTFHKGDFDALPPDRKSSFDFVISDAVLEHVPDMPKFAAASRAFLKPRGVFYASFGPLWFGPSGDHAEWGLGKIYDHVLLSKEEYEKQLKEHPPGVADQDSCDTGFMIQQGLFSYLRARDYLADLDRSGFNLIELRAKISPAALRLLRAHPELHATLDAKGIPAFDRFSGGLYVWARKNVT